MENTRPQIILVNRCFIFNEENKILLVRRHSQDKKDPDKWEVPGGKLDACEDLSISKKREILEEVGLVIEEIKPLVFAHSYIIKDGGYKNFTYISLFSLNKIKSGEVLISEEHSGYEWVVYKDLKDFDLTPETQKAVEVMKDYLLNK